MQDQLSSLSEHRRATPDGCPRVSSAKPLARTTQTPRWLALLDPLGPGYPCWCPPAMKLAIHDPRGLGYPPSMRAPLASSVVLLAASLAACLPDFSGLSGGSAGAGGAAGQGGSAGLGGANPDGGGVAGQSGGAGAASGGGIAGDGGAAGASGSAGTGGTAGQGGAAGDGGAAGSAGAAGEVGDGTLWSAEAADDSGNIAVIAATETEVYWVWNSKLLRAPIAGGQAVELASGVDNPREMLVDQGYLFLAETGRISACTLPDCKDLAALITGIKPRGLALDGASIFWVEEGTSPDFTDGTLQRCGRFGCASPTLMTPDKNEYRPGAVAAGGGAVFWLNRADLSASNGLLKRLDASGPGGKGDELLALLKAPSRLAFQGGTLFWIEEGLSTPLRSCQASSCAPTPMLAKPSAYPVQGVSVLRADGDGVYWINDTGTPLSSTAMRCPLAGCTEAPMVLWEGLRKPGALATSKGFVLFGDASAGGSLYRRKKP